MNAHFELGCVSIFGDMIHLRYLCRLGVLRTLLQVITDIGKDLKTQTMIMLTQWMVVRN